MKKLQGTLQRKFSYRAIVAIFLILCLISGILSFQYYAQLQAAIRSESRDYLQEISYRIGSNVNRIIDDNYASLYAMGSVLMKIQADSFETVRPIFEAQREYLGYESILLMDANGKAYDSLGREAVLNNDTYFNSLLNQQKGLSTTQMIDNQECIMLIVPLNELVIDGKKIVGIAATYLPAVFEYTLAMSSFDGQAYSCVIGQNGAIIVRPTSSSGLKLGYNVLTSISETKLDEGDSIEQIKQNISQNSDGQIGFTRDNIHYYMVYTPINFDGWYLTTFVPTHVINAKSDMLLNITLFLCGLIAAIFAGLVAMLLFVFDRNKRRLEQIAFVDDVTGGHTIQKIYQLTQSALAVVDKPQYALVYTNWQKFKVLNEQFGRRACDALLREFHNTIAKDLHKRECIGRLSADNFCIFVEYEDEQALLTRFAEWHSSTEKLLNTAQPIWSVPITEFGVYIIDNDTIPFTQIIDRAKLALREFSKLVSNKIRYAIYNNEAHQQLFREKQLEDCMELALQQNEFQMYLQPKYSTSDNKIYGAEALARWFRPDEGMIYPNEFIPLFEKNGFVVNLDLWMFEEACKALRSWLDRDLPPLKISVNCSRMQLNNLDFLENYRILAERYAVPPSLLEIELTESLVMEDVPRLCKVIDEIHALGFGCSMDDFGSGYSSLNLIQSIPVDTLKLDKIFFQSNTKDSSRMESVVSSIVTMAKALSMETISEGIEYQEHLDMLKRIGCDYVQGYIFAKPMPLDAFETLAFSDINSERKVGTIHEN